MPRGAAIGRRAKFLNAALLTAAALGKPRCAKRTPPDLLLGLGFEPASAAPVAPSRALIDGRLS